MINIRRKTALTASVLTGSAIIILLIAQSFKGIDNNPSESRQRLDTIYNIKSFKLPDEVTFAGEKMPLDNFDTRESLEREILTSAYRHSSTILIIKRANRYLPLIERILKKNNIPDDFKYLVAAESEYSNMVSPAGATGFWQIMTETGKEEGLEINTVIDERYDVEKSTQFACDYFMKSYEKFGNWTLTAASYDGGRAAIDEQIEIQHQHNYYDLLLSDETARYIFRAVAYKLIISDPENYGFKIEKTDLYPELKFSEIKVDSAVSDLSAFAEKFGTNYKILKILNPWLRKPYLTPKSNKGYLIKIPSEGMRSIEKTENGVLSF
ncbi:MAG: lytic transglycosylase domain-containing protein [Bacteroidales bacterium]